MTMMMLSAAALSISDSFTNHSYIQITSPPTTSHINQRRGTHINDIQHNQDHTYTSHRWHLKRPTCLARIVLHRRRNLHLRPTTSHLRDIGVILRVETITKSLPWYHTHLTISSQRHKHHPIALTKPTAPNINRPTMFQSSGRNRNGAINPPTPLDEDNHKRKTATSGTVEDNEPQSDPNKKAKAFQGMDIDYISNQRTKDEWATEYLSTRSA